ncbi:DUF5615 family PIN-like protein [Candidatus Thiosymbion oneisti]|uniref:DUF5615 family PIN-like protein n=1 Tax=Candidatus Thiosymbion oneisti TaxID=589554 RepID=UPI000A76C445|nr:DUF5615 family PIN-like protein [Candidatus Thiosymbion oneisti]
MRFLVDAQLPRGLVGSLTKTGHDVIHTLDLPEKNRTSDHVITAIADEEERVVVTKDADFVNSFLLHRHPKKLLLISTGNISNRDLETVVLRYLPDVVRALNSHDFVEMGRATLSIHA